MTRVGFATGYDASMDARAMAAAARMAEERGYEIAFFSETNNLMRDSVTVMAAMGLSTSRITLGCTQIVRLRSPVVMAQTAASLDELMGGRLVLVPGACTTGQAHNHGLPHLDPALTLTEWVEAIRLVLTGEKISYQGQVVKLDQVGLGWRPVRQQIPLWFASMSRTGLELAGRLADGVLLNAVTSPEYSANAVQILKEAVARAGRDWERFEVAQIVNCSVEDEPAAALGAIRWEVASKFDPTKVHSQVGMRRRVGEPHIRLEDMPLLEKAGREGGRAAVARALPDYWVENLTASGTPDMVKARVQLYRQAGVKLPILRPAARHQVGRLLDLFAP